MKTATRSAPTPKLDALGRERRTVALGGVEIRTHEEDAGGPIGFKGHAAIFGIRALIRGWWEDWMEEVARGAFRKTIKEADVRMLINHNPDLILGRNKAETLRLAEDDIGLATDADMAPTSYGKDLAISLERGDITQMSYAFEVVKESWDWDEDPPLRTIEEVRLWDVSAVTYPAFTETDASLRGAAFETLCRSMDLTGKQRDQFLRHLATGHQDPQFAPTLAAAGEALQRMARSTEPAKSHSDVLRLRASLINKKLIREGRSVRTKEKREQRGNIWQQMLALLDTAEEEERELTAEEAAELRRPGERSRPSRERDRVRGAGRAAEEDDGPPRAEQDSRARA